MSNWICVNSHIRIETFGDTAKKALELRKTIKNIGLPNGTEGTLSYRILPSKNKYEISLTIFGDLRDCSYNEECVIKMIILIIRDFEIRQGFIQVYSSISNLSKYAVCNIIGKCSEWSII